MSAGQAIVNAIFAMLDVLPSLPASVMTVIDKVFQLLFSSIALVSIFIDINMVKTLIPFVIAILNFDKLFKFIMFVLKKIPVLDIK
jgi:hypothetical protein